LSSVSNNQFLGDNPTQNETVQSYQTSSTGKKGLLYLVVRVRLNQDIELRSRNIWQKHAENTVVTHT
jgi:hypothetical protein